ncbi:MAG: hypothetical protein U0132_10045 [Gemmatimonadaceae bacterium]
MSSSVPPSDRRSPRWRALALVLILFVIILGVVLALRFGARATPLLDTAS